MPSFHSSPAWRRVRILAVLGCLLGGASSGLAQGSKPRTAARPPARGMAFQPAVLELAPGETYLVELFVPSPTGRAHRGALRYVPGEGLTVIQDARWRSSVPPWGLKTYPRIKADPGAAGEVVVRAELEGGGTANLTVRIVRPEVSLEAGLGTVTARVTSPFSARQFNGRVSLSNPDRFLQDVTTREFKLAPGATAELVFPLPGAAPAEDELYDFTLRLEGYHGYRLRRTFSLAFPPQPEKE